MSDDSGYLCIKNWDKFQHYKERNTVWIKLYTSTIDDYQFTGLSDHAKLLAFMVWILAGKGVCSERGFVPNNIQWIRDKCCISHEVTDSHVEELIASGFLSLTDSCYQPLLATPAIYKRKEKNRKEENREENPSDLNPKQDSPNEAFNGKKKKTKQPVDITPIIDLWNNTLVPRGIPKLEESLTKTNTNELGVRLRRSGWMESFPELLGAIMASDWHMGKNDVGFVVSASWLVKDDKTEALIVRHRTRESNAVINAPVKKMDWADRQAEKDRIEWMEANA